jgi:hypothetical protein
MAEVAVIAGSIGVFVTGFLGWYALWHRRLASSFERVPVRTGRTAYLLREGVVIEGTHRDEVRR